MSCAKCGRALRASFRGRFPVCRSDAATPNDRAFAGRLLASGRFDRRDFWPDALPRTAA